MYKAQSEPTGKYFLRDSDSESGADFGLLLVPHSILSAEAPQVVISWCCSRAKNLQLKPFRKAV